MTLKELRKKLGFTQKQCAEKLSLPKRTYERYENSPNLTETFKYKQIYKELEKLGKIDEEHGILTLKAIETISKEIFDNYKVQYAYLFGSYSKGTANEQSDVDVLIATETTGLRYYELVETLREKLCKKVDLLNVEQLKDNLDLLNEILKDGVKIYG